MDYIEDYRLIKCLREGKPTDFNVYDAAAISAVVGLSVQSVGAHVAIYVDTLAPANGLNAADVDTLQQLFDTHVYVVDTTAFGGVSDLDSNGPVITLMTPVVNASVTAAQCTAGGFVAGFFYPGDLDSIPGSPSNHGEIFYTVVADPNGAVSCAHSRADVKSLLPTTSSSMLSVRTRTMSGAPSQEWFANVSYAKSLHK